MTSDEKKLKEEINELRRKTGAPFQLCLDAVNKTVNGTLEERIEYIRKHGKKF